jgi:methionyl-tRNA formyltransferase
MSNEQTEKINFKKKVLFVGIPDMAYICLDGLDMFGVNIVGVIGPKKNHQTYKNFKKFVEKKGLNFIEYDSLKDPEFIEKVKKLNADIAVVCSFNYKIPKILLNAVKDGFINVHPSLLPKYRGPNPYSAAILNGERESGVTLHFMDEEFDTGDIISQRKLPLTPFETMGTIFNRTNILAFNMLIDVLKQYENSPLPRVKQPEGEFATCKIFGDELFFIDYEKDAKSIERFVRALNPFIIATTNFRKNIVKVFTVEAIDTNTHEDPGTIVKIKNDKFYIATAEGLIAPTVLQFGSFFVGTSNDFIRILNLKEGEMFL